MIKRIKWFHERPDNAPYVLDIKLFDIPNTMYKAIMNAPDNCVAVSVSTMNGRGSRGVVERAARRKGMRILWSKHF